jgi:hypothetical protein
MARKLLRGDARDGRHFPLGIHIWIRGGLVGMEVDDGTGRVKRSLGTSTLSRSFSPAEIASIIEDNKDASVKAYPDNQMR